MTYPKVVIVILNWNGKEDTLACLESVFAIDYPNFQVVVVDNGSSDDSVPAIRQAFPQACLIETGKNLGYAGGNNVGIRYALEHEAEYVFILNNDTKVAKDVLTHLVAEAEKDPQAAALGPVICYMDRPEIIWTAGEVFDKEFTCVHLHQGESLSRLKQGETPYVDWITGAALFARASALQTIGLFDERCFLVYEESDWCFRARKQGLGCRIVPQAIVWHKVASSFGSESSPLRAYFSARNQLLFAERHLPKAAWLKLLRRSLKRFLPKFLAPKANGVFPKKYYWALRESWQLWQNPKQIAIRKGVLDYLLRRFGDCPNEIRSLAQWRAMHREDSTIFSVSGEQTDV